MIYFSTFFPIFAPRNRREVIATNRKKEKKTYNKISGVPR